jgi:type I restriction enzyme M protein
MTSNEEQQFLNALDKKLWTSADKLRSTLDASQYKHTVLGLMMISLRKNYSGKFYATR